MSNARYPIRRFDYTTPTGPRLRSVVMPTSRLLNKLPARRKLLIESNWIGDSMEIRRGTWAYFTVWIALLAGTLAGCGGSHARFLGHLKRGDQYLASGNLDKASIEYRNASQIEPKNPEALYDNGLVAERRGNVREAVGLYMGTIDLDPNFDRARGNLGRLFVFASAGKRALETVRPALERHPDDPDLLSVRAAAERQLGDDANALKDAERAHQVAPTNENALAILASLYTLRGETDRATALVEGAVHQAPASVDLRSVLISLYLRAGRKQDAQEQMRQVIKLVPTNPSPRIQLAQHLLRDHRVDEAQAVLEQAVRDFTQAKDPSHADQARMALVDFVSTQRSREQGEKTLRGFIAQAPEDLELRLGLGALLERTGALDEAVSSYETVVAKDGTAARGLTARVRIASIRLAQGKVDQAQSLIAQVLAKSPRDDGALTLRARIELQTNDPNGAVADLRAVLRDQPKSSALQRALASAYTQKGDLALADEALNAALESAPDDVPTRVEVATHLAQSNRVDQAITVLKEGVRRAPQSEPLQIALIKACSSKGDWGCAHDAAEALKTTYPQSPNGSYFAGMIALQQKHFDDAAKELEHALELKPHAIETLVALVQLERARSKPAAAVARVQSVIHDDPANPPAVNLLGELYMTAKNPQKAAEQFSRAISLSPTWWAPHRNLAVARQAMADTAGALEEYKAALKQAPLEEPLVVEVAQFLEKQGQIDAAIGAYRTLYDRGTGTRQIAANNLAMLLVTYRTDRASLDQARDLSNLFAFSDNGSLLDTNGWVRFKRGEYRDALTVLERASTRVPESKVIRYHLAMTELRLGMTERARADLQSVLASGADFSGADEARSALAGLSAKSG
jgi:tetratricopeptide (TPR) repeat protein